RHARGRVPLDVVRDAVLAADFSLAGSPDVRSRLAAIVSELADLRVVTLPRGASGWDRGILPPLPLWLLRPARQPRRRTSQRAGITWHAQLGWAAAGGWTDDEQRLLEAVNDWLIRGGARRPVPVQERSLELLGDEKALGRFLGGPLFTST